MKRLLYIILFPAAGIFGSTSCKKPYTPPATQVNYQYLVVDGVIINSPDSPTVIRLSMTVPLSDSTSLSVPEKGASVSIQGNSGENFPLSEQVPGSYVSSPLPLTVTHLYRLSIKRANGKLYQSDFVPVGQSPPIDSVTWAPVNGVTISVATHDPLNITQYYRWDFTETWQYRSTYARTIAESNGLIYYVDSTNQTYNCWSGDHSTALILGSTVALDKNVISGQQVAVIPQNDEKISVRYTMLLKQYALTAGAFQYFQVLKTNTENLGSIFDAQPTQLVGNVHAVTNPKEVVIGYITASSVRQQRIFISNNQLPGWAPADNSASCALIAIDQNPVNYLLYTYSDTSYTPYFFISPSTIQLAKKHCVDCTTRGGTTSKPPFW